mmetsp:Transcript_33694/g.60496  ORF Transcript_33694/g.60496 Transcript_33694/m.60496 type:complete len:851 (+) Transcript_33694:51-2603(+)
MQNVTAVDESLCQKLKLEPGFVAQLLPQLVELVRASRRLPQGQEHAIRRGSRDFLVASRELGQRSIGAAHRALQFLDPAALQGKTPEDLGNFNLIVDSIDSILERVDGCLRDAKAGVSQEEVAEASDLSGSAGGGPAGSSSFGSSRSAPKPQVRWRQLVDNDRTQFVPRIIVKHNQRTPLHARLVAAQRKVGLRSGGPSDPESSPVPDALRSHLEAMGVGSRPEDMVLPHPYEEELADLAWPDSFFAPCKAQRYNRMEDTPLVIVRTERDLRQMIQEIQATCLGKEIAVDVEHHDFRSYRGFVCLVQVSTRQKDFLIDPFEIFAEMHLLNEIFSDPRIVKVLHGADRDVMWLQRDFSVYLVNMFDTGQATRALKLQGGFSYANLVSHFCGVKLDKKYQTADWRERPLLQEMVYYARADTHYLLFCYDCLRNALLAQSGMASTSGVNLGITTLESGDLQATQEGVQLLQTVMEKSAGLCRFNYQEAPLDAGSLGMSLCERFGSKQRPLETKQFSALRALVEWRDQLARRMDESLNYVAPDASLWRVSLAMPSTPMHLRSSCNPLPPTLQLHAQEVVDLICRAAETADVGKSPALSPTPPPALKPTAAGPSQASPSVPDRTAVVEAGLTPASIATRQDWPARSPGVSPRPLVHVTASFGRGMSALTEKQVVGSQARGNAPSQLSVLCPFAESESSAEEEEAPKLKAGKLEAIRRAISFSAPAPVAMPQAAPAASTGAAPGSSLEQAGEAQAANGQQAADSAQILRPRKKKRRVQASAECLETVVIREQAPLRVTPAATAPVAAAVAHTAVGAAASIAQASEVAAPDEVPRSKKRKIVKRKVVPQDTLIDPYL